MRVVQHEHVRSAARRELHDMRPARDFSLGEGRPGFRGEPDHGFVQQVGQWRR